MGRGSSIGRLIAWRQGIAPTEIWRTLAQWEDDIEALSEMIEQCHDEVKPILEERERSRK